MSDKINTLVEKLKEANKKYRLGNSIMSDSQYDTLVEELQELDPENPFLLDTGSEEVIEESRKIDLPIPMHSFEKVYVNEAKGDQLTPFLQKHAGQDIVGSLKMDGAALLVEYRAGQLFEAYTKGRGGVGQTAKDHALAIPSIPNTITEPGVVYVKCELEMPNSTFDKKYSKKALGAEGKANPRNLVSGLLNTKLPSKVLKDTVAIAHSVVTIDEMPKSTQLKQLAVWGFVVVKWWEAWFIRNITVKGLGKKLEEEKAKDFLCDGIVLEVDDPKEREKIGHHTNGNPKFGVAFKIQLADDQALTKCTSILWRTSKEGKVVPRISYESVELLGTTCTAASGKNYKFVKDNKIGPGAELLIQKGGDIIPDIIDIPTPAAKADIPTKCPSCGTKLLVNDTGVSLMCHNAECPAQKIKRAYSFLSKLGVESFAEKTVEKVMVALQMNTFTDFFKYKPEDIVMDGIGEKSATKFYGNFEKAMLNADLATLMHATGHFGTSVGSTKLQWVIDEFEDKIPEIMSAKWAPSLKSIEEIKGYAENTAENVYYGLRTFVMWYMLVNQGKGYKIKYTLPKKQKGRLSGKKFVFSGFRNKDLEDKLKEAGGEIVNSVNSETTALVVEDVNKSTSKTQKAIKFKIPIIKNNDFITQNQLT